VTVKAILFDMDGVLIDAKEWHYEALNRALDLFGMPISRFDHLTTFDGLPTRKKLEMLSLERGLPRELHEFVNEMKQRYTLELVHTRCKPRFAHERLLSSLRAAGLRLAVCSNSVRATVDAMMERSGLAPWLHLTISNEDVARAKPDPEMYLKAMAHFGLDPDECLVVEDNEHGVRAARAAGAHVLAVRGVEDVTLRAVRARIAEIEAERDARVEVAA
jgi:HAD superfamily hydrolase (TIGR01509 family)